MFQLKHTFIYVHKKGVFDILKYVKQFIVSTIYNNTVYTLHILYINE